MMQREVSSSKLMNTSGSANNNTSMNNNQDGSHTGGSGNLGGLASVPEFEELIVTIKKSERGFGFDLKNGILVQNVYPSTMRLYISPKTHLQ